MSTSKTKKPIKGQKQKPMSDFVYQSIMGEYLISPFEYMENPRIQRAVALNDEIMLRKILQCEY
tara:strand:+ start:805 stop:996 length:192 start_codon:yes stop_codon:yes gene_type:complete